MRAYRDALGTLNRAATEAVNAILPQLEAAITKKDRIAAEGLLAKARTIAPEDERLAVLARQADALATAIKPDDENASPAEAGRAIGTGASDRNRESGLRSDGYYSCTFRSSSEYTTGGRTLSSESVDAVSMRFSRGGTVFIYRNGLRYTGHYAIRDGLVTLVARSKDTGQTTVIALKAKIREGQLAVEDTGTGSENKISGTYTVTRASK